MKDELVHTRQRMSCCERIAQAEGNLAKAHAALDSYVQQGGYDHWGDVVAYAKAAADEERAAVSAPVRKEGAVSGDQT